MKNVAVLSDKDAKQLNPIVLAFVGDAVHTLFVRQKLVLGSDAKAGELHKIASKSICATHQSRVADSILPFLTEDESDIFKRARNAHTHSAAKNAQLGDYKKASGFEAVLGYLYLTGQEDRLAEIIEAGENI